MSDPSVQAPPDLRALVAADLTPVRPLRPPLGRAVALLPLALLLLVAAPLVFELRDVSRLGWFWSWGASLIQMTGGLLLLAAALNEAIPGRPWPAASLAGFVVAAIALVVTTTWGSWQASPVLLRGAWWSVGAMCLGASVTTALPAMALAAILAVRALPTRPVVTGLLIGLGAGLLADAGWRLFCHYSEPAHVLAGHLGAVLLAGLAGAALTGMLARTAQSVRGV